MTTLESLRIEGQVPWSNFAGVAALAACKQLASVHMDVGADDTLRVVNQVSSMQYAQALLQHCLHHTVKWRTAPGRACVIWQPRGLQLRLAYQPLACTIRPGPAAHLSHFYSNMNS